MMNELLKACWYNPLILIWCCVTFFVEAIALGILIIGLVTVSLPLWLHNALRRKLTPELEKMGFSELAARISIPIID